MATLYDLAMQYLNQSLPKTFKYDRTNQPTDPVVEDIVEEDTVKPLLSPRAIQPGGDGFSVYNPDPNRTRNESNYNPRTYNKVMRNTDKFGETVMPNPDLYYQRPLEGIPGMVQGYLNNSLIGKGLDALGNKLPVNQRAIYENELLGQGIMLDDIGRIVSDGGNINTAENIMAGYNANKVTAETFQKRRDRIKKTMSQPGYEGNLQEKLDALDAAEAKMLGTAKTRADTIFEDEMITKDPSLKGPGYLENAFNFTTEEDNEEYLDYTNPNIYNTKSIYTQTAPTYTTDPYVSGQDDKDIGTTPSGTADYYGGVGDSVIDAGGTAPGGGYTSDYYGGGNEIGSITNPSNYGTGSGNLGDYQMQPSKPETKKDYGPYSGGGGSEGGGNGGKSIVCTAMYQTTGLEDWSKAMKIWYIYQKKYLTIQHQEGYHKLFKPFVKGMHKSNIIKAIGAHVARNRTQDLKHIMFGSKPSWLGRIYRKILEPICYIVGKYAK